MIFTNKCTNISTHITSMPKNGIPFEQKIMLICFICAKFLLWEIDVHILNNRNIVNSLICRC